MRAENPGRTLQATALGNDQYVRLIDQKRVNWHGDGRIIHAVDSPDSWFETAALIDPRTGRVDKILTTFSGDVHGPGWTKDGRIIATGLPTHSSLWRFRPAGQ